MTWVNHLLLRVALLVLVLMSVYFADWEILVFRYVYLLSPSASIILWMYKCRCLYPASVVHAYLCISADFLSYLANLISNDWTIVFIFHIKVELLSYGTHTENITVTIQYFILLALSITKTLQFIYWLLKTNTHLLYRKLIIILGLGFLRNLRLSFYVNTHYSSVSGNCWFQFTETHFHLFTCRQ